MQQMSRLADEQVLQIGQTPDQQWIRVIQPRFRDKVNNGTLPANLRAAQCRTGECPGRLHPVGE
jgi:hypothetical protein